MQFRRFRVFMHNKAKTSMFSCPGMTWQQLHHLSKSWNRAISKKYNLLIIRNTVAAASHHYLTLNSLFINFQASQCCSQFQS